MIKFELEENASGIKIHSCHLVLLIFLSYIDMEVLKYVTEHRKRDHFGQKCKTELLAPPYSSCLGL